VNARSETTPTITPTRVVPVRHVCRLVDAYEALLEATAATGDDEAYERACDAVDHALGLLGIGFGEDGGADPGPFS